MIRPWQRLKDYWPLFRKAGRDRLKQRALETGPEKLAETEFGEDRRAMDEFLDRELRKLGFVPFDEPDKRKWSQPLRALPDPDKVQAVLQALQRVPTRHSMRCDPDALWDLSEFVRKKGQCYCLQSVSYDDDGLDNTWTGRDEPIPLELGMPLFKQALQPNKYDRMRDIWLVQFENGITVQVDQMTGIRSVSDQTTCYALFGETVQALMKGISGTSDSTDS